MNKEPDWCNNCGDGPKHTSHFCDACGAHPITTDRFHCETCGNYDQCLPCYETSTHPAAHVIIKMAPDDVKPVDPKDLEFHLSIAGHVARAFGHAGTDAGETSSFVLETAFSSEIVGFEILTLFFTLGSNVGDDLGRVAATLQALKELKRDYPNGQHRGVCMCLKGFFLLS